MSNDQKSRYGVEPEKKDETPDLLTILFGSVFFLFIVIPGFVLFCAWAFVFVRWLLRTLGPAAFGFLP